MFIRDLLITEGISVDDQLVDRLKEYFDITPLGGDLTEQVFNATLTRRFDAKFGVMPFKLGAVNGTMHIIGRLDSLDNMPDRTDMLRIENPGPDFQLISNQPISIGTLRLNFMENLTSLENSGNIQVDIVNIVDAPSLTTLAGIELMNIRQLSLGRVDKLIDDLSKLSYIGITFRFVPTMLPLVNLIAYNSSNSNHPKLSQAATAAIVGVYPETEKYFGRGAHAIPGLVRIFQKAGHPQRYADVM